MNKKHIAWFDSTAMVGKLKGEMAVKGYSLRRMAEELDLNPSTLSRIFRGHEPGVQTATIICAYLEVSLATFVRP